VPGVQFEFLVEGESDEIAVRELAARALGPDHAVEVRRFQGKEDLLARWPERAAAYARIADPNRRIVVVLDNDRGNCIDLRRRVEAVARTAGLKVDGPLTARQVVVRIAMHELEAWFLGDVSALRAAYPGVPETLAARSVFRDVDSIERPHARLERVLQNAGYHASRLDKIRAAQDIAPHMNPRSNRSRSFCVFVRGLRELAGEP